MLRSKSVLLVGVLVIGALGIAACSKGSGTGDATEPKIPIGEISKLVAKAQDARYRVTYRRPGLGGKTIAIVIAQDPPKYFIDTGVTSAFKAKNSFTECDSLAGVITCKHLPAAAALIEEELILARVFGTTGSLFLYDAPAGIKGLSQLTPVDKTIAGRAARCVTLTGATLKDVDPSATGSFTACVDAQSGVMLESRYLDVTGTTIDVIASAYGEPVDSDFTPPSTTPPATAPPAIDPGATSTS